MKSRARNVWQGDLFNGSGETTLESGAVASFPVSWSSRTEVANGKTSPEELIAAAHASCLNMAFSNILAGDGNTPTTLETTAVATFEKVEAGFRLTTMVLSCNWRRAGHLGPGVCRRGCKGQGGLSGVERSQGQCRDLSRGEPRGLTHTQRQQPALWT